MIRTTIIYAIVLICFLAQSAVFAKETKSQYDHHNRRDPFWRLVTPDGIIVNYDDELLITDMFLEGIIYDRGKKSLAIINGSVIKVNDKIGLYTVRKITKRKVYLIKGDEKFVLQLKKED